MPLLNFSFIIMIINIIHKNLALIKNHWNYLKDNISKCFFRKYNSPLFLLKKFSFSEHIMMVNPKHEEENYYKPVSVNNFWSNNYIEYESNGDTNKTLSVEEYFNKISPYL